MAFRRSRGNIRRPRRAYRRRPAYRARYARRSYRRSAASTRMRRAEACHCETALTAGDKFVLVQADPFEPKFGGAKVPDSSTIPSIATPVTASLSCITGAATQANWNAAWAFYPTLAGTQIAAVGTSTSAVTWTGAVAYDFPQTSSYIAQFEVYRPVAHGIRLSCPFAPTSTTGFVHVALAVETSYNAASATAAAQYLQLPTSINEISGYPYYKRVTLASLTQSPLTIINKWTDETAFRYSNPDVNQQASTGATGMTFHIPYSWGTLVVMVEGYSSVTTASNPQIPLQAEVILHTEAIPTKTSTILGNTAAASEPQLMSAVSQAVANTDFSHTEDRQDQTISAYMGEVANAAGINNESLGRAANFLGRQALRFGVNTAYRYYNRGRPGHGLGGVNDNPARLLLE